MARLTVTARSRAGACHRCVESRLSLCRVAFCLQGLAYDITATLPRRAASNDDDGVAKGWHSRANCEPGSELITLHGYLI